MLAPVLAAVAAALGPGGGPDRAGRPRRVDGGVGVLLGLLHRRTGGPTLPDAARAALLRRWLAGLQSGATSGGLFGAGLAGHAVGLAFAAEAEPRLRTLAAHQHARLSTWIRTGPWRTDGVGWSDYDLISGPAGVLLGLASRPDPDRADVAAAARHLAILAGGSDLGLLRLRRHAGDGRRAGRLDHLDYGLAHGLAGVLAALTAAGRLPGPAAGPPPVPTPPGPAPPGLAPLPAPAPAGGPAPRSRPQPPPEPPPELAAALAAALRRTARRLRSASTVDSLGVVSWPADSGSGVPAGAPVRRQAWCYGTPGVAWALWAAGDELGDRELTGFAAHALTTLCAAWDDDRYLYGAEPGDRLGICHGAAGILAIADAFARHAAHGPAAGLRAHLTDHLRRQAGAIGELARTDLTLLTGAAGVLAVLSTVDGGDRGWLPHLGLR